MKPLVSVLFFLLFSITGIFGNANVKQQPVTVHVLKSCMEKVNDAGTPAIKAYIFSNNTADELPYIGEDEEQEETVHAANTSGYIVPCFYLSFIQIESAFTKPELPFCKTAYTDSPIYIRHRVFRI